MFPAVDPVSSTAAHNRLRMLHSRHGGGRVTPDLERSFQLYNKPTSMVLHFEPGRTLGHNLNRLPSPCTRRDLCESILVGGNHPDNPFRHMNKTYSNSMSSTHDTEHLEKAKRMSMMRDALEFDTAVRREQLMKQQNEEQELLRRPTAVAGSLEQSIAMSSKSAPSPIHPNNSMSSVRHHGGRTSAVGAPRRHILSRGTASRPSTRASTSMSGTMNSTGGGAGGTRSMSSRESKRRALLEAHLGDDFSLKNNSDYHTPFEASPDPYDLNCSDCVRGEVDTFEAKQQSPAEQERRAAALAAAANVSPPKLIVMMFKFGNVRTLPVTEKLRHIGYPTLHEQFSTTSERGCVTRQQFIQVLIKFLPMREVQDALKILYCFDRTALGDVDLNVFLLGLQILLRCATAGDALRYCFTLMDTNSRIPRYVTRFEIQTLVDCASSLEEVSASDEVQLDREYEMMSRAIREVLAEAWRYDYLGRIALKVFLDTLQEKIQLYKGATKKGTFVLGNVWEGTGAVAAVHRMSSRNLLLRSLTPQVNPKDPHAIPIPPS